MKSLQVNPWFALYISKYFHIVRKREVCEQIVHTS
jgi:hypothetical protein